DLAETCTGVDAVCPVDAVAPDSDGDGICDPLDGCTPSPSGVVHMPRVTLHHLTTPPGDDTLVLSEVMIVPKTPPIDPVTNGLRLALNDRHGAAMLALTIPGGAYDRIQRVGWRTRHTGRGTLWRYVNRTGAAPGGITDVVLWGDPTTGYLRLTVRGKH